VFFASFLASCCALKELIGPNEREAPNMAYLDFSYAIEEFEHLSGPFLYQ
jgi:hypothetical protein